MKRIINCSIIFSISLWLISWFGVPIRIQTLLQAISLELVFVAMTVGIVDGVVEKIEREKWQGTQENVKLHIKNYIINSLPELVGLLIEEPEKYIRWGFEPSSFEDTFEVGVIEASTLKYDKEDLCNPDLYLSNIPESGINKERAQRTVSVLDDVHLLITSYGSRFSSWESNFLMEQEHDLIILSFFVPLKYKAISSAEIEIRKKTKMTPEIDSRLNNVRNQADMATVKLIIKIIISQIEYYENNFVS